MKAEVFGASAGVTSTVTSRKRCFIALSGLMVVIPLGSVPSATALKTTFTETDAGKLFFLELSCGVTTSETVFLGRRVSRIRVERPQVGHVVDNELGEPIGTISGVKIVRRGSRRSVRFSVIGSGELCASPDVTDPFAEDVRYRVRYRYRIPKRRFQDCGSIAWDYTRTDIRANGYVKTCRKARKVARVWRQNWSGSGFPFETHTRQSVGYTCRFSSGGLIHRVSCRKGRGVIRWSWAD